MTTVAVINTGGTISCIGDPLTPMTVDDFKAASESLLAGIFEQPDNPDVIFLGSGDTLSFPESSNGTLDSTNLQPSDWCIIAENILNLYDSYDGFVVLHGTDTMAFTGAALSFLLNAFDKDGNATAQLDKPVIITGSQVPMYYTAVDYPDQPIKPTSDLTLNFNTDAYQNLCGAIAAAAQSEITEVCVYFDSYLFRGNRCVKTDASEFKAFSSPNYPPLGQYGLELEIDVDHLLPAPTTAPLSSDPGLPDQLKTRAIVMKHETKLFPVMQLNAFPAWYTCHKGDGTADDPPVYEGLAAKLITACQPEVKGIILESYGAGNFPSGNPDDPSKGATYKALQSANDAGVIIVDCTQVIQGSVDATVYAAGSWLSDVGALNSTDMTAIAAFTKLMILGFYKDYYVGDQWTTQDIKDLFKKNLLGEMADSEAPAS